MAMTPNKTKIIFYPLLVGLVLLVTSAGVYGIYEVTYQGKILPGVRVLDVSLGNLTRAEATAVLKNRINDSSLDPLKISFEKFSATLDPKKYDFKIDETKLADNAYLFGRRGSLIQKIDERLQSLSGKVRLSAAGLDSLYDFDKPKLMETLGEYATVINRSPEDPKLTIQGNRATEFVPGHAGIVLNREQSISVIIQSIFSGQDNVQLAVEEAPAKVQLAGTNKLGINKLVARGVSDFKGSPKNRIHNINVGARRFDGLIIPAGSTFSFTQNLGDVDAKTGYLPELVIKGDKTEPEFGGGLCQVSTTAFRAILNGGLPVVERRNHSYRVAYYEPAGTDATIYQPYPDLKFKNDTPGSILMDTYIEGTKLYFDFYGTDIGRTTELDGPHVFNVTPYPEPIYIDTSTLEPGVTKKVDTAHQGADAVLNRKIFINGKLVSEDSFKSHYIPWPAKYLRGVAEAAPVTTNPGATPPPGETPSEVPQT